MGGKHFESTASEQLALLTSQITTPTAQGIAGAVGQMLRGGDLNDGSKLPPVRELARQLHVSPATVSQAWSLLRRRGLVTGRGKAGITLSRRGNENFQISPEMHIGPRDLRFLTPDPALLPSRLPEALTAALSFGEANTYSTTGILPKLEEAVGKDWPYAAESFLAVNGGADGLDLALQCLTIPGDRVVLQNPTAPTVLRLIKSLGLVGIPVEEDQHGLLPSELETALHSQPTAMVFQPRSGPPAGTTMSSDRAKELAALLEPRAINVIEFDDVNQLSTKPAVSLGKWIPSRTIVIRSFSKSHGPDLRVGVVGGSADHTQLIYTRINAGRRWTSKIMQGAVAWMLEDPRTADEIQRAREIYSQRLLSLRNLLGGAVKSCQTDGLCLWVEVDDEVAAHDNLVERNLLTFPGARNFHDHQLGHLRIATSRLANIEHEVAAELIAAGAKTS